MAGELLLPHTFHIYLQYLDGGPFVPRSSESLLTRREMHRATNMAAMIGGRAVQGIGGSGIGVLCEMIICDLVPLRERGTYLGIVIGMVGLGAALGPLFGGLLVSFSTWRWAFYLALPIGGTSLVLLFAFLHVKYDKSQTLSIKLSSLDWLGNVLFIGSATPVLIALSMGGRPIRVGFLPGPRAANFRSSHDGRLYRARRQRPPRAKPHHAPPPL